MNNKNNEEWRVIPDFPNYSVSNFGNIKNNRTNKILKANRNGVYERVRLRNDSGEFNKRVHRLVLETFSPISIDSKLVVNHKDGNKYNNNLDNLEWVTQSYNTKQAWINGRRHCNQDKINLYYDGNIIEEWKQIPEFPNYLVSNWGNVYNTDTNVNNRITLVNNYPYVTLYNKSSKKIRLSQLVYKVFNDIELSVNMNIKYIDGNKLNNCLNNLKGE